MNIAGKKILFFCPRLFNYEREIAQKLREMGAEVFFRSAQPVEYAWFKALIRLFPRIGWFLADIIYGIWLKRKSPPMCDIVFVLKGEGLSPAFLKKLKGRYEDAKFFLYLWDSISNVAFTDKKFQYFDNIFSFDPVDCQKFPICNYRPLFFLDKYLAVNKATGNDIFFVGTLNGDRASVIAKLKKEPVGRHLNYWLFVRSKIELFWRELLDQDLAGLEKNRLMYKPMLQKEINDNYSRATAILDIEHPDQTGLTMRTFEVLASGKKLITTNRTICSHDFYSSDRIAVIDRNNPVIPTDFLSNETIPVPEFFLKKYSLSGWLCEIFETACCNCASNS